MRKRLRVFAAAALLAAGACFSAFGQEDVTVAVEQFDMEIQIPGDWNYFTVTMEPDNPLFAAMGVDGKTYIDLWKQNGIHIDAMSDDLELTLVDVGASEDAVHLASYSDKELDRMMAEVGKQNQQKILGDLKKENDAISMVDGLAIAPTNIHKNGPVTYMVSDIEMTSGQVTMYGQQYYTVVNSRTFTFNFNSLTGKKVTDAQKDTAQKIMDSVTFGHLDKEKKASRNMLGSIGRGAAVGAAVGAIAYCMNKILVKKRKEK